jgi:flagellar assembly protein FliH
MTLLSEDLHEHESRSARCAVPLEFEEIGYPALAGANEPGMDADGSDADLPADDERGDLEVRLQRQAEQHARELEEVRSRTREEVRHAMELERNAAVAGEREAVLRTCEDFLRERTRYFAAVEEEVVRLSLAIAARILHREVGLDPMLLKGAVRVALEKLQGAEPAVLSVPKQQAEEWKAMLMERHRDEIKVVGDERLQPGECALHASVGRLDLGVKAQLDEIEKGFFDLLQQRPA